MHWKLYTRTDRDGDICYLGSLAWVVIDCKWFLHENNSSERFDYRLDFDHIIFFDGMQNRLMEMYTEGCMMLDPNRYLVDNEGDIYDRLRAVWLVVGGHTTMNFSIKLEHRVRGQQQKIFLMYTQSV